MWQKKLLGAAPYLASSQDPEKISLTVQAAAVAILPVLTLVLGAFGVDPDWLKELVVSAVAVVSAGLTVWGVWRKKK